MPRVTVCEAGAAEMLKSGGPVAVTTRVTIVECVRAPLVPVIVTVYVPAGVAAPVVTLMVLDPEPPATGFGLNDAPAPDGSPLALSVTLPVKPPDPVTVAV